MKEWRGVVHKCLVRLAYRSTFQPSSVSLATNQPALLSAISQQCFSAINVHATRGMAAWHKARNFGPARARAGLMVRGPG